MHLGPCHATLCPLTADLGLTAQPCHCCCTPSSRHSSHHSTARSSFLRVVKLTLLGSVISNLLLVMGCAFLAGGLVHPQQRFNQQGINVNCGLLILSGAPVHV